MLIAAALLAIAPAPPRPEPLTYVTYVGQSEGHCFYQTGDVLMDAAQFEHDLRTRFDRAANLIVYHGPNLPPACLATALRIARRVGFRDVRGEIAPPNLSMAPPG
jgi:hypothetical protein